MRSVILNEQSFELPHPLNADALGKGQAKTPQALLDFFLKLYTRGKTLTDKARRQAQSTADDVIFIVTRGLVKPGKHICLGMGIKSITGSRSVLDILNRFGHAINYHTAESLETELAATISYRDKATPDGLLQIPGLATSIAWDNYDEITETLSGSNSLHDTAGICYQNVVPLVLDFYQVPENVDIQTDQLPQRQGKRSFAYKLSDIEPYKKNYDIKDIPIPSDVLMSEYKDLTWMACVSMAITPMWSGWNSQITEDKLPQQRVTYMNNPNLSPTRPDVIVETLKISQKVAIECGERYIVVHYDLAIAKPAMQIQFTESPKYDNVFIGPFHIYMAYFAVLGYYLDGSGGPEILTDSGVLAPGSLNGFLAGKHYNR